MKIVIVNKSDSTGGAAVVAYRLMQALRDAGVDARMIVAEKLTGSPYVELAASPIRLKLTFMLDRLRIALANGFNRSTLFKLDAAVAGIDISRHPLVKEADAIFVNWINQGLLSLKDIRRLGRRGKRIVWTMHDMWNMTGLCHHAGTCRRYESGGSCGDCPLLVDHAAPTDLSRHTWRRKKRLYDSSSITFVAVSSWLAAKARESALLSRRDVRIIPNAFHLPAREKIARAEGRKEIGLIFGAARLDDDVKGFPIFLETLARLKRDYPREAAGIRVILYGDIRDRGLLERIPLPYEYVGMLRSQEEIKSLYCRSDIVVSTSLFETLPGTLIEGQAYGCFPVSFGRGGQRDIIDHGATGMIAEWDDDSSTAAGRMAGSIIEAIRLLRADSDRIRRRMYDSVSQRFSAEAVAAAYLRLLAAPARHNGDAD